MVKHFLRLCLAVLATAAVLPASAQINTTGIPTFERGLFNVAEAYPSTVGGYSANLGISDPQVYRGACASTPFGPGAAPGILCLARNGYVLDVNCFAVTPPGEFGCVVQAYRLFKKVPGSFKCPDVYGTPHFDPNGVLLPYTYVQFGSGIRTWWSLNFTQPGTEFCLQVVSACQFQQAAAGRFVEGTHIHKDNWRWRVVADVHTLANVIELMHSGAVSTLEIPCILGEDMYDALKSARDQLERAIASTAASQKAEVGDAVFDFEALIIANCLFVEVLNPILAYPGPKQFGETAGFQPPGNLAQTVFFSGQGSAVAGIIDTVENPCCCKLLVDLEWILLRQGIVGQSPSLPVF